MYELSDFAKSLISDVHSKQQKMDKCKTMSFVDLKKLVRTLDLKSKSDWYGYVRSGKKPSNAPTHPAVVYKNHGWNGWYDFLGIEPTDSKIVKHSFEEGEKDSPKEKKTNKVCFLPFEEAREFARSQNLKSYKEWVEFKKSGKMPGHIPMLPYLVYKNHGWSGIHDWLGYDFLPFEKARDFVRSLRIKNISDWKEFKNSSRMPSDIPKSPQFVYKDSGWRGFIDWLGCDKTVSKRYNFLPFEEARNFIHSLGLKGWEKYSKSGKRPKNIPSNPERHYKNSGWISMSDWLGLESNGFLPFEEARNFVRGIGLENVKQWHDYAKSVRPSNIPSNPDQTYEKDGWVNWGDWIGKKLNSKRIDHYLPFDKARDFARSLNLRSRQEWNDFVLAGNLPRNIPLNPSRYYRDQWVDYADWFGI